MSEEEVKDRYKETSEIWNKAAMLYQEKFMDLDLYNETYDFFCNSIIKNKAKILEIGCGPGNITRYVLTKQPDFNIYGIDIAANMIELAKINNPSASFNVMDSRQIRNFKSTFDGIISGFCIPYLSPSDCEKLIIDSYNLLNEEGVFYLSFVEGDPEKSEYLVGSSGDRIFFYYYNLSKLINQLNDARFKEIKIFNLEYKKSETEKDIHTILIAKK